MGREIERKFPVSGDGWRSRGRGVRILHKHAGRTWEIDVFEGENAGLVVAEIELESENEPFDKPPWAGAEVTDDPRYYNVNLALRPYRRW